MFGGSLQSPPWRRMGGGGVVCVCVCARRVEWVHTCSLHLRHTAAVARVALDRRWLSIVGSAWATRHHGEPNVSVIPCILLLGAGLLQGTCGVHVDIGVCVFVLPCRMLPVRVSASTLAASQRQPADNMHAHAMRFAPHIRYVSRVSFIPGLCLSWRNHSGEGACS